MSRNMSNIYLGLGLTCLLLAFISAEGRVEGDHRSVIKEPEVLFAGAATGNAIIATGTAPNMQSGHGLARRMLAEGPHGGGGHHDAAEDNTAWALMGDVVTAKFNQVVAKLKPQGLP